MPKSSGKAQPAPSPSPIPSPRLCPCFPIPDPCFSGLQTPKNAETPPPPPQIRQKIEGRIRLTDSYSMSYKNRLFTYW